MYMYVYIYRRDDGHHIWLILNPKIEIFIQTIDTDKEMQSRYRIVG